MPYIPMACPTSGSFIGWKKAYLLGSHVSFCGGQLAKEGVIVKLEIAEDAKRSSSTGRKCRCSKAKVLEIQTIDGKTLDGVTAHSAYVPSFEYTAGKIVEPNEEFCEERFEACASGIHFFIDREEAVRY